MTESKAVELLEYIRKIGNGETPYVGCAQNIAIEMAINALEKQMQKKVKYEDVGYDQYNNVNVYACICPSCGLEIIRFNDNDISDKCESGDTEEMFHSSMVHHAYIGLNNYCNRCGQKLNWESDGE